MANNKVTFLQAIANLSPEVYFYFEQDFVGDTLISIAEKYNLENKKVYNLLSVFVINKFDIELLRKGIEEFNLPSSKSTSFLMDFLGRILLPIDKYILNFNIAEYIKNNGGNFNEYKSFVDRFLSAIDKYNDDLLKNIEISYSELDREEEKTAILDLFNLDLVKILKNQIEAPTDAVKRLNSLISSILDDENDWQKTLLRVLLSSKTLVTSKKIEEGQNLVDPSVANWIKNFIDYHGSDFFDNLVLVKYLSDNKNIKILSDHEKKLVKFILKVYRNIAFFFEQKALGLDNYREIIPVTEKNDTDLINTKEEKDLKHILTKELSKYDKTSLEYLAIKQEIDKIK